MSAVDLPEVSQQLAAPKVDFTKVVTCRREPIDCSLGDLAAVIAPMQVTVSGDSAQVTVHTVRQFNTSAGESRLERAGSRVSLVRSNGRWRVIGVQVMWKS
jgi:hypothetical protein